MMPWARPARALGRLPGDETVTYRERESALIALCNLYKKHRHVGRRWEPMPMPTTPPHPPARPLTGGNGTWRCTLRLATAGWMR